MSKDLKNIIKRQSTLKNALKDAIIDGRVQDPFNLLKLSEDEKAAIVLKKFSDKTSDKLLFDIGKKGDHVTISFSKPVEFFGLEPAQALILAQTIFEAAAEIDPSILEYDK